MFPLESEYSLLRDLTVKADGDFTAKAREDAAALYLSLLRRFPQAQALRVYLDSEFVCTASSEKFAQRGGGGGGGVELARLRELTFGCNMERETLEVLFKLIFEQEEVNLQSIFIRENTEFKVPDVKSLNFDSLTEDIAWEGGFITPGSGRLSSDLFHKKDTVCGLYEVFSSYVLLRLKNGG